MSDLRLYKSKSGTIIMADLHSEDVLYRFRNGIKPCGVCLNILSRENPNRNVEIGYRSTWNINAFHKIEDGEEVEVLIDNETYIFDEDNKTLFIHNENMKDVTVKNSYCQLNLEKLVIDNEEIAFSEINYLLNVNSIKGTKLILKNV